MGRNLLRTESWHRKIKLRSGQTIYFNNGLGVEQHRVIDTYVGKFNGKVMIHTVNDKGEHHLETKLGQVYLGSNYRNVLVNPGKDQHVAIMKCDKYAKLHPARGKANRDKPMEFWESGRRSCTIIPLRKKVTRTRSTTVLTGNKMIDPIAGNGLRTGELVFVKQEQTYFKQSESRIFRAATVVGAAAPNRNAHSDCPCCELNKR